MAGSIVIIHRKVVEEGNFFCKRETWSLALTAEII
jgi:hypothetical protein